MTQDRDRELSLMEHLTELKRRLTFTAIAVAISTAIAFTFAETIVRLLLVPSGLDKCVTLNPTESFTTFMRVAFFAGLAFSMPVALYELYMFIDPALHKHERRFVLSLGPFVLLLFVGGMTFSYYVLLPQALGFLVNFGGAVFDNQLRCSEYLSFVTTFILGIGLVFETPALIFGLVRVGIVKRSWLAKQRRYAVLAIFVVGAIVTPTPDPFNQALVAGPMYLLFELGLLLARLAERARGGA